MPPPDIRLEGSATRVAIVTGATGFIGSNLVAALLERDRSEVWCVVRPSDDAAERVRTAVLESARAAGAEDAIGARIDAIGAVEGDVRKPGFGLSAADTEALTARGPVEIWHSAASLRYEEQFRDEILKTNVDGVRHAIEMSRALGVPEFNLISTAYVAGTRPGSIPESQYDAGFPVNNWYEESKRRGETLALDATGESGTRLRIFRPSIVIGNMSTCEGTSSSGYYGFVSGLATFSKILEQNFPDYMRDNRLQLFREPNTSLNLMPIDELVREAIAIADDPNEAGTYFHLTNPFPVALEQAQLAIEAAFPRMHGEWVEDRDSLDEQSKLFDAAIEFYSPYLRNDKRFGRVRDGGQPPPHLRITTETLTHMTIAFRERRRRLARERSEQREGQPVTRSA